jgi:hypothetical protein
MYKKKRCECGNKVLSGLPCCGRCMETLTRLKGIKDKFGLKQMVVMAYRDIPELNVARYFLVWGISSGEAGKQLKEIDVGDAIRLGIINAMRDLEISGFYCSTDSCTNWAIREKD